MENLRIIRSVLLVLFLIISFISLNGCNNDSGNEITPSSSEITVSGKVLNVAFQYSPNVTVVIDSQSAITSSDGNFSFSNVKTPYNLKIIDGFNNSTKYYYGLTAEQIRIPADGSIDENLKCLINVSYPPGILSAETNGKIIFTDFNYVNSYGSPIHNIPLEVRLTDDSPVTGKLILITYKTNTDGKIVSYENFGQSSPITVSKGGNYTYDFTSEELSLNPGEETISGSIIAQPGFNPGISNFSITFTEKRTPNYSAQVTFENINESNFSIIVPANLPIQFSNLLFHYMYSGQLNNSEMFKLNSAPLGNILETKKEPKLLTPEDNAVNVNASTTFLFATGSGMGIYQVNLIDQNSNQNYMIFMTNNSFTLNDFSELFPDGISNMNFKWNVDKIGFSFTIDEFVTDYTGNPEYFRNNSLIRSFSTAE